MIDYETFCKIRAYREGGGLKVAQIARALDLDRRTVAKWIAEPRFRPRQSSARASKLDPYKSQIRQWLEAHPYSTQQVFQRLREDGFEGGYTIVKDYVRIVRPRRAPAFLTLSFAPGKCAQVDWGSYGTVAVGQTRRELSLFVMVLCYSRLLDGAASRRRRNHCTAVLLHDLLRTPNLNLRGPKTAVLDGRMLRALDSVNGRLLPRDAAAIVNSV
jgi:transposase